MGPPAMSKCEPAVGRDPKQLLPIVLNQNGGGTLILQKNKKGGATYA